MIVEVDHHALDKCECGGVYDCWTMMYDDEEKSARGCGYRYTSEWLCRKCNDQDLKHYDDQMCEI